ncbi:MAG: phosphotransferase family protein [Desulfobacteraceae bacterium]|nr:MAG: phosphotransferase family protein [Desulfobacteraceae bacterium]
MDLIDAATTVRKGEELDVARIEEFIKDSIPGLEGSLKIHQFPKGHSNLTYLLTIGNKELVLRRPPFGRKAKSAHDMSREYRILKALRPVYQYCPEPLVYSEDETIMGSPFYIMQKIEGIILRRDFPEGLTLAPSETKELYLKVLEVQYELHTVDYVKIGLENLGKPNDYIMRQVTGWCERYKAALTPDAPGAEKVMDWLTEHMPPDSKKPGIIHNDFKLDNIVLDKSDPMNIVGVLDWEMATIGDPLMDLGSSLAYWIQNDDHPDMLAIRMMPTNAEGAPTRKELVKRYALLSGLEIAGFDFYYCFGLFRLAAIAQQIYYRYYHGQTKDERFKAMIIGVHVLVNAAQRTVAKSDS